MTVKAALSSTWAGWDRFWFGPTDLLPISAFRLAFGSAAFVFYALRQWDFEFLYSSRGMVPHQAVLAAYPDAARPPLFLGGLAASDGEGLVLHSLFVVLLLGLALGAVGRGAAWLALLLHVVFFQRNPFVVYGPDQVAACWLFYLCFMRSDAYLAVPLPWRPSRAWLGDRLELTDDPLSAAGRRLLQIHLCVIYAYSGLHKLKGGSWWRGDALWNALANGHYSSLDMSLLAYFPWLAAAASLLVVLWEVYFPVVVWVPAVRGWVLAVGVVLHVSIGLMFSLHFFSLFMVAAYVLFLDPIGLRRWLGRRVPGSE